MLITARNESIVIASHYRGYRLNSPNDVAVAANGNVYFTDPTYGILMFASYRHGCLNWVRLRAGLPFGEADAGREMNYNGIFLIPFASIEVHSCNISTVLAMRLIVKYCHM